MSYGAFEVCDYLPSLKNFASNGKQPVGNRSFHVQWNHNQFFEVESIARYPLISLDDFGNASEVVFLCSEEHTDVVGE